MFQLKGTGHYLPRRVVTSIDLDSKYGHAVGTFEAASGVRRRHYAEGEESSSYMGARAATAALGDAGVDINQIDLIMGACGTPEQAIPCTAALIQRELGLGDSGVACFDINSTCLSFVVALRTAAALIAAGVYRNILIVSSDVASVGINYEHLESAALFGDGAAAVVVGAVDKDDAPSEILGFAMQTYASGADTCQIQAGGSRLHPSRLGWDIAPRDPRFLFSMDGPRVYRLASSVIGRVITELQAQSATAIRDAKLVIPHQASGAAIELIRRKLEIAPECMFRIIEDHGNMIAASLPLALHYALKSEQLKKGDLTYLIGTSAGFTVGGLVLRV